MKDFFQKRWEILQLKMKQMKNLKMGINIRVIDLTFKANRYKCDFRNMKQ